MVQSRARIQLNTNQVGTSKINPYLFGHFVEDIRDHMDAMLAYPLRDMDFESMDEAYRGFLEAGVLLLMGKARYMDLNQRQCVIPVIVSGLESLVMTRDMLGLIKPLP